MGRVHAREDGQPALLVTQAFLPDALRDTVAGRIVLARVLFLLARGDHVPLALSAAVDQSKSRTGTCGGACTTEPGRFVSPVSEAAATGSTTRFYRRAPRAIATHRTAGSCPFGATSAATYSAG